MPAKERAKRSSYLRKADVAKRYAVSKRSIERMVKDKRIPQPEYPTGELLPLWGEDALDAHDRAMLNAHLKKNPRKAAAEANA